MLKKLLDLSLFELKSLKGSKKLSNLKVATLGRVCLAHVCMRVYVCFMPVAKIMIKSCPFAVAAAGPWCSKLAKKSNKNGGCKFIFHE